MEYSLRNLNKNADLENLTLTDFIETLNLIGLEVDEVILEKSVGKKNLNDINLDLKIPANREDLLNETILINEFSTIFLFHIYKTWQHLKNNYIFLLKKKYCEYSNYSIIPIDSSLPGILTYGIKIINYKKKNLPNWLQKKLGLNKTSNIIEALINLTIKEWGQNFNTLSPQINNLKIERLDGEKNFLFQDENYLLKKGTIVLKNETEIISVIGIINANRQDTELFLEGTFYDINKNILKLNDVNTKLSFRYLRRNFLTEFKFSFQRLLTLIELITEGKIDKTIYKNSSEKLLINSSKILKMNKNSFKTFLNINDYDLNIFEKSNLKLVCTSCNYLFLQIPEFRKDLTREIDLIEEYARFIGYKNFQEIIPKNLSSTIINHKNKKIEFIKQFFINNNFNEVFTNSLVSESKSNDYAISLANPLNSDLSLLRTSLLENLIEIYRKNLRVEIEKLKFFEIGRIYKKEGDKFFEEESLGIVFPIETFKNNDSNLDFFTAKGFIEQFLLNFTYKSFTFEISKNTCNYYHPKKFLNIYDKGRKIGTFGEIHPKYKKLFSLKQNIYLFEFNLDYIKINNLHAPINLFKDYSKYPVITKDLSITISKKINFYDLKQLILNEAKNLKSIKFFDVYFDSNSEENINLGIRLEFQCFDKTLLNEDIEKEIEKLLKILQITFSCDLKK